MKSSEPFWRTTLIRGAIALFAGSLIPLIPDVAITRLRYPLAVVLTMVGLAGYGIVDSVLVFVTSYMTTSRMAQIALRIQGVAGLSVGSLLIWMSVDYVQMSWFIILIAIQSLSAAIGELVVARHSKTVAASHWNLAAACIAFGFSCTYVYILFGRTPQMILLRISWLVFGYLIAFGFAQCLTAARMLAADDHIELRRAQAHAQGA